MQVFRLASFQGVYAWILVGSIYLLVQFVWVFGASNGYYFSRSSSHEKEQAFQKWAVVKDKCDMIFAPLTLLCIYNMGVICRMQSVRSVIKHANLKFVGVRLLLLASQIQFRLLNS